MKSPKEKSSKQVIDQDSSTNPDLIRVVQQKSRNELNRGSLYSQTAQRQKANAPLKTNEDLSQLIM